MTNFVHPVVSLGATHFREALGVAGAATPVNALPGVPPVNSRRYLIRAVRVLAMEHIGMTWLFFASAAAPTADVDTDRFISSLGMASGTGVQYNNAGLWRYFVAGLAIPYYMDGSGNTVTPPTLNVALQLEGATTKAAGDAGEVSATFWLEPLSAMN